jgi:hypothetical protein
MDIRSISTRILGTAALIAAIATPALADTISGWGTRDLGSHHSTFTGSITEHPDGSLTGHFTILTHNDGEEPTACRYLRFLPNLRGSSLSNFNAYGVCWTPSGTFAAENRIVLVDGGTPGAGVDYIDVNYLGATGVSIPGGFIDDGEFVLAP